MSVTQLSPQDAFKILKMDSASILIDVRTVEEWNFVGFVDSAEFSGRMAMIPWKTFPAMEENPDFLDLLSNSIAEIFGQNSNLKMIFICRTGGRSNQAAHYALNLGYQNCYNVSFGFEGDLDSQQHRGTLNGWKASNLPWRQS